MSPLQEPFTARFDADAVQALGRLVDQVLDTPYNRSRFLADPPGVAQEVGIDVANDEKMRRIVYTLAEMSPAELRLLTGLNRLLIAEGLYVETGNPPLMVY
jgi:hypothetical protein